jgi:hypothetical protein
MRECARTVLCGGAVSNGRPYRVKVEYSTLRRLNEAARAADAARGR